MPPSSRLPSRTAASHAVSSPSTSSRHRAATCPGGYQPPGTCPRSVSHALRAFLRPTPAGLVSCRSRPWGFALQGLSPLAEQCVLSDVDALLGLTGLPGFVSTVSTSSGSWGTWWLSRPSFEETSLPSTCPSSGPCSLRVSVSPGRLFKSTRGPRPSWAFSSLGASPSPSATFPGPSSHGLRSPVRTLGRRMPLRVLSRRSGWLDSLEPASLSEVCHLLVDPGSSRVLQFWVAPRVPTSVTSVLSFPLRTALSAA
jgi:hypothetical protein